MVSRIGTAAHNQALVQQMLLAQTRVSDTQMQVGTEKKSQTYKGISTDSFRLISLENERLRMEQYVKNNAIADTNAKAMVTTVESMDEVIRLLRSELIGFTSRDLSDASPEDTMAVTNISVASSIKAAFSVPSGGSDDSNLFAISIGCSVTCSPS